MKLNLQAYIVRTHNAPPQWIRIFFLFIFINFFFMSKFFWNSLPPPQPTFKSDAKCLHCLHWFDISVGFVCTVSRMRNLVQPLKTVVKCSTYMYTDSLTEFSNKSSLLGKLLYKKKKTKCLWTKSSLSQKLKMREEVKVLKQVPLIAMSKALTGL